MVTNRLISIGVISITFEYSQKMFSVCPKSDQSDSNQRAKRLLIETNEILAVSNPLSPECDRNDSLNLREHKEENTGEGHIQWHKKRQTDDRKKKTNWQRAHRIPGFGCDVSCQIMIIGMNFNCWHCWIKRSKSID